MSGPIRGHRDARADAWSWELAEAPGGRPRGPRLLWSAALLALIVVAIVAAGVAVLLVNADDGDSSGQTPARRSPVLAATKTPTATSPGGESPSANPTLQPPSTQASVDSELFVWSRQSSEWLRSGLVEEASEYHEGDAVPFMLRIDNAAPGSVYEVELVYECRTTQGAGFDYLTTVSAQDSSATRTEPGPGPEREDASIPVPDDPSIGFDRGGRRLLAWGGSFHDAPEELLPGGPCVSEKRFRLDLIAHAEAVFLVWGGHLALSSEWGEDEGASIQTAAIHMEVSVDDGDRHRLAVGPGIIVP